MSTAFKLFRTPGGWVVEAADGNRFQLPPHEPGTLTSRDGLHAYLAAQVKSARPAPGGAIDTLLPPIEQQEVWAAGVTYFRSRTARMEESKVGGGGSFYDLVYNA